MRPKDISKQKAIIKATVKLVNDVGFVAASVSKIAREASVSPATMYVYYNSKEDLLATTYKDIKKDMSVAVLKGFDETLPIRDIFLQSWFRMFDYIKNHRDEFQFTEQFVNSPYGDLVDRSEVEAYFEPLILVLLRGIQQKIIKHADIELLGTFLIYPIMVLSNPRLCINFSPTRENIEAAFNLAWDAVKY